MLDDKKIDVLKRFAKHTVFSLFGTGTDTLVLWLVSHFILNGSYTGQYIISPIISFECGNIVNFIVSSRLVWRERMLGASFKSHCRHFLAYNLSYTAVLLIKTGLLLLFESITGWDVVICNILALMFAGIINFIMNDKVIFSNGKEDLFNRAFNRTINALTRVLHKPEPIFLDERYNSRSLPIPCILVSNHTCNHDIVVLNSTFHNSRICSLAAKERFKQFGYSFFLKHTRCIPYDRCKPDTSWIHEALHVLNQDKDSVAIYPEGFHGKHREMLKFQSNVTLLVLLAKVPVVLVYQDGPHHIFHKSQLIVAPPKTYPVPEEGINVDSVRKVSEELERELHQLMEKFIETTR